MLCAILREKATSERVIEIMGMSWLSVEEMENEILKLDFRDVG